MGRRRQQTERQASTHSLIPKDSFSVQLFSGSVVALTRREWRLLQDWLSLDDMGIGPAFKDYPANVVRVIRDLLKSRIA